MKWQVKNSLKNKTAKLRQKEIVNILLENRNITTKEQADSFLHPKDPMILTAEDVGVEISQLEKAIERLEVARKRFEKIVIFGDYDADGITATATMWEVLYNTGLNITPFIPHRERHGYGLSIRALEEVLAEHNPQLIITVDNGIVAHEAADFLYEKGIDLILTDHHVAATTIPKNHAIVHTTRLAGAGVSWFFCKEYVRVRGKVQKEQEFVEKTLELATIGTVADQVPLMESNRSIVKYGIEKLRSSKRVGLLELFIQANFDQGELSTHHINFVIAPRINAMGRLAHGLDSLRLLCTNDAEKAKNLAKILGSTNQERQDLTFELVQIAKDAVGSSDNRILVIDNSEFHEGVIGLVAGKLTESYFRPSIVIGTGSEVSKGSARSVPGVNIIELIRKASHLLINAGGHPMAAGFTIYTKNIEDFKLEMKKIASEYINPEDLVPAIEVDCEIELKDISWDLYKVCGAFEPFGVENRKPLFCIKNQLTLEKMTIGKEGNHLKIILPSEMKEQQTLDTLWFGKGDKLHEIEKKIDMVFTVDENSWKGKSKLQLMLKDVKNLEKEKNRQSPESQ